jgi:imidazolonepropionase-like amidohydrolase
MARTVFTNANLLDGSNPAIAGANVVVDDERIAYDGTQPVETHAEDRVIDLGGKTLMPGMVQAHFHTGFGPAPAMSQAPILGLEAPMGYMGMIAAMNAGIALDSGVTSIIGSSNPGLLDVCLKEAMVLGVVQGPRVIPCTREFMASGDQADGTNRSWFMDIDNHGLIRRVDGVEAMRAAVREELGRGCEVVKLSVSKGHGSAPTNDTCYYTEAELAVAVETAEELGGFVRAHAPSAKSIKRCAEAGLRIIDHADMIDEAGIEAVVKAGAFITPSMLWSVRFLAFAESWDHSTGTFPIGEGFPEPLSATLVRLAGVRREFEYTCKILPELEKAGIRLLVGDDFGFPMMPHGDYVSEYEIYTKQLGIPALSVLRWATRNGAEAMGMGDDLGTIEAGKLADLLIVDGDPSADISVLRSGIQIVMKNGEIVRVRLAG